MNTFDLKQAAPFLKMHPEEVRRRARLGLVPEAKPGKSSVLIEEDLAAPLRRQYAVLQPMLPALRKEQPAWQSTSGATPGASTSPRHGESTLNALLRQAIRPKRGDSTPG